jgi:hypothetical protein
MTVKKTVNAQCHPALVTLRGSGGPVDGPQPCCQWDSNPHLADLSPLPLPIGLRRSATNLARRRRSPSEARSSRWVRAIIVIAHVFQRRPMTETSRRSSHG